MVNNNSKKYPYKNSDYNACLFNLCGIFSITQIKIFIKYFYVKNNGLKSRFSALRHSDQGRKATAWSESLKK